MVDLKKLNRSTRTDLAPKVPAEDLKKPRTPQQECRDAGGTWNVETGTCIFPSLAEPTKEEVGFIGRPEPEVLDGRFSGEREGRGYDPRNQEVTYKQYLANKEEFERQEAERATQELVGQVGDIQPSTGIEPTGLDVGEAATVGLRDAIPRALTIAGGAAVGGAALGAVTTGGLLSAPLAIIGATVGFVGSIASSMIGNFKSQRTDTTTAQQRILDEGKQTLKDWSTLAKSDPTNKEYYLSQFNRQLQQIQDAHVQMITDTNADVAKFETALPNLAEFNSFYSIGGERDALVNEMVISLQTPASLDYDMLELTNRRFVK